MKQLYLFLVLWVLGGCFLSGECHRGPRRRHETRRALLPLLPSFGSGFARGQEIDTAPHNPSVPEEIIIQPPPFTVIIPSII
uniref:submaxillary gland androgen-regulated protein 2-like n=1 Tax=Myodes glareolus TaxID=447135 RepID=UPI0020228097|nr:submaxillary gland androgen-regulated protein 2-like [Myodes glareolus]